MAGIWSILRKRRFPAVRRDLHGRPAAHRPFRGDFGHPLIAGDLYGCAVLHATADGVQAPASQAAGPCLSTAFLMEHVAFAFGAVVKTRQRLAPVLNAIMIC